MSPPLGYIVSEIKADLIGCVLLEAAVWQGGKDGNTVIKNTLWCERAACLSHTTLHRGWS